MRLQHLLHQMQVTLITTANHVVQERNSLVSPHHATCVILDNTQPLVTQNPIAKIVPADDSVTQPELMYVHCARMGSMQT